MRQTIKKSPDINKKNLRVFISYAHENEPHRQRVYTLSERLRADGIDAEIDQYHEHEGVNWPDWTMQQIRNADYVLVISSESYKRRFEGDEPKGKGAGAKWEGAIIKQDIYEAEGASTKFIPVSLTRADEAHIPTPLRGANRFLTDDVEGYEKLYRRLTDQPSLAKSPLGEVRELPPATSVPPVSSTNKSPLSNIKPRQTDRAKSLLTQTLRRTAALNALQAKLALLDPAERAFIAQGLLDHSDTPAIHALLAILDQPSPEINLPNLATAVFEKVLFGGDVETKARLMNSVSACHLSQADVSVRDAFFAEMFDIMLRDQYGEVNLITPAVVHAQDAIPPELYPRYIQALISQTHSQAFQGGPAARRALTTMSETFKRAVFAQIELDSLESIHSDVKDFVKENQTLWPSDKIPLFQDYVTLGHEQFAHKWRGGAMSTDV